MKPFLLFMILSLLTLTSCEHRPLCFDHSYVADVRVEFQWNDSEEPCPVMVVWFFPIRDCEDDMRIPERYELSGSTGGYVRLPAGPYECLAYNGDTERNRDYGETFGSLYITTGPDVILSYEERQDENTIPVAPGTENHDVRLSADRLWRDRVAQFTVLDSRPHASPLHQVVTFAPEEVTTNIYVIVKNVKKLTPGTGMRAVITSVSERFLPGPSLPDGNPVTVPFNMTADATSDPPTSLTGKLIVFGHCHDTRQTHYVSLYHTKTKQAYHFDVTGQMESAPDPRNIYIIIDGKDIDPDGSGGLGVYVGDWGDGGDIGIGAQ